MKCLVQINRASNGEKRVAQFLGYDPGGSGRNGVAAARIRIDGIVLRELASQVCSTNGRSQNSNHRVGVFPWGDQLNITGPGAPFRNPERHHKRDQSVYLFP